jgi:hypothetical protein
MTIILAVLLLVMIVRYGRSLAAHRYEVELLEWEDELPADYGMNSQRPWERRPRHRRLPSRRTVTAAV